MKYNFKEIEKKWQKLWEENKTFSVPSLSEKPKKYILDMFPYPSGTGLHVGHPKGYTATDIVARHYHAKGFNVLHPMGFDAFGLPAENFAIKTGTHPAITIRENINTFVKQLKAIGLGYDWDKMIDTTNPKYYKWTQWIFLELFKKGLAYEQNLPINYCSSCKTGLANEEVLNDFTCERCGTKVEKRKIRQWVLAITKYADRLLEDLDDLDWTDSVKEMQKNWIGKSEGCEFEMQKAYSYEISPVTDEEFQEILAIKNKEKANTYQFEKGQFVVARDNGKMIAFGRIRKDVSGKFEFGGLYVDEKYRGNKVGYEIIHYLLSAQEEEFDSLYLDTDKELQVYYEKCGFKKLEQAEDFQIQKNKEIYDFYNIEFNEEELQKKKVFMKLQKNEFVFPKISVYTTRVDTVFGVTYAVMAPDHPNVTDFITTEQQEICQKYIEKSAKQSDQDRTAENREKTGVFTGSYVINPFNNRAVPLWIGDYVLGSYGTGAVMAVPAHDERDFDFAKKYDLPIIKTICSPEENEKYNKVIEDFEKTNNEKYSNILDEIETKLENNQAYTDYGFLIVGSGDFPEEIEDIFGKSSEEAKKILTQFAHEKGFGAKKINYKLRDWLFSRQRYWGEPIPLIHLEHSDLKKLEHIEHISQAKNLHKAYILKREPKENEDNYGATCGDGRVRELIIAGKVFSKIYDGLSTKVVIDSRLPLILPKVEKYEPAGDGNSPLANVEDWVNIELAENLSGKRETNTMPQWGGSCWYYLRYLDPNNEEAIASREILDYWQNVDEYVGGTEHTVLHLLYARFWHKVLYDLGVVPTKEPFQKLINQGMILAYAYERTDGGLVAIDRVEEKNGKYFIIETGEKVKRIVAKMSKSLKNTANPLDIIEEYGADTLRLYEMSIGDFRDSAPWNPDAIIGVHRFLEKVYNIYTEGKNIAKDEMKAIKLLHKTIKKVEEDICDYKFNTAISAMMILVNEGLPTDKEFVQEWKEKLAIILHPFAPHIAEELWEILGKKTSIFEASWPEYDDFMLVDDEVTIAVQVNGKLRGTLQCFNGVAQEEVSLLANADPQIVKWLEGKTLVKEIFIPNKMLSIVVK